MTDLVVRRLLVDLQAPIGRHWCGGDPFRTALFNALSMSFPVGEQFFIDSVRAGFDALPADRQARFDPLVKGFAGQEATHRRLHGLFNDHLERQGLVNGWAPRALKRLQRLGGADPRHAVAATAAYEHFTSIMADWMLENPDFLDGEERLRTMWLWHAAEECEHRSVAFDVYGALDGSHAWRVRWFVRITLIFLTDALRQTIGNLHRDRTLWQWRTWQGAAGCLFSRRGLVRRTVGPWRCYLRAGFHPSQQGSEPSRRWLAANRDRYAPVGGG